MGRIPGIVMYADDGIIVTSDLNVENELLDSAKKVGGIILAEDKNNGFVSKFKFLGLDYDLDKWTVSFGDKKVNLNDKKGVELLSKYAKYSTTSKKTPWEIREDSILWLDRGIIKLIKVK